MNQLPRPAKWKSAVATVVIFAISVAIVSMAYAGNELAIWAYILLFFGIFVVLVLLFAGEQYRSRLRDRRDRDSVDQAKKEKWEGFYAEKQKRSRPQNNPRDPAVMSTIQGAVREARK